MGWMGWLESVKPVMGDKLGNWVVMSVKRSGGGGTRWLGGLGGCSWISRMSSGFDMTGFYWDFVKAG